MTTEPGVLLAADTFRRPRFIVCAELVLPQWFLPRALPKCHTAPTNQP